MRSTTKQRTPKFLLLGLILALVGASGQAVAQDEDEDEDAAELERVEVTGTRIDRVDVEGTSPITSFSRSDIENSGVTTIQELLREVPSAAGPGTFNTFNDSQDDTSGGTAAISLRGLGASSTLTLINGRRWVRSATAQSITTAFTDLNSIPIAAIKRVDILKDGASPVYGTDAIAGVVNIILRDDFEGLEISGTYGTSHEGDADETNFQLTWGTSYDRGNIMVALNHFTRDLLIQNDRDFTRSANFTDRGGIDFRSSSGNPGSYAPEGLGFRPDPACPAERNDGTFCRFDFGPFLSLQPKEERTGLTVIGDYEITDDVSAFTELAVHRNSSFLSASPSPAFTVLGGFTIPADHPNNPFPEEDGDLTRVRRRLTEFGPRQQDTDLTFFNTTVGLEGSFAMGNRLWNWEASFQYGMNDVTEEGVNGFINSRLLQNALNDGSFNPFGCQAGAECTGPVAGTQSVEDILDNAQNPSVPPGQRNLEVNTLRKAKSHQRIYNLEANGDIFELPGGTAYASIGYQHRENDVTDIPDIQFLRGEIVGTESTFVDGRRNVEAIFGELVLPVIDWAELQLAGRWEDYSDFGSEFSPKVGLLLRPIENFKIRGTWSESFRAPSLAELGNISDESPNLVDPIRCPVTGDAVDCGEQETIVRFLPTQGLEPETSTSYTLGGVWQATEDISLSLDWWRIEVENLIGTNNQFLLNNNADNPDVVVRFPQTQEDMELGIPGRIRFIRGRRVNFGQENVAGLDANLNWQYDAGDLGRFVWDTQYTHFLTHERRTAPGTPLVELAGRWDTAIADGRPEDAFTSRIDWAGYDFGAHLRANFRSGFDDDPNFAPDREVDSHLTFDAQVRYMGIPHSTFAVSVQNLFNEDPEFVVGSSQGRSFQDDPVGRFFTFTYTYRM